MDDFARLRERAQKPIEWLVVDRLEVLALLDARAEAAEAARRKALEDAAKMLEDAGQAAEDDDAIVFLGPFCRAFAAAIRAKGETP